MKFAKLLAEAGQGDPRQAENLQLRYKQLKKHLKILSSLQGWHLPNSAVLRHDLARHVQPVAWWLVLLQMPQRLMGKRRQAEMFKIWQGERR